MMEMKPRHAENENENEEGTKESSQCCSWCHKLHTTVSNWMLPEDIRSRYLARANCLPPPLFIISISLAELAIFIYYAVWMPQKQWITLDTGMRESPFIYRPDKRQEAWRFISYMLVHAGVQHLIGNLLMQLILGIPLEMVHKGHRVGLVYIAGVIGVGTDVGFALYRRFLVAGSGFRVSFVAHIAGGLAGMTIGYVVFSCYDRKLLKDPRFWASILAYIACLVFAIIFNIFLSPAP
ncbi:rhomboid-related protein 2 isoform X2 [Narcine bancroftii]|uniref:rhomboid-related protein 2 isoform X2 n=1 Tax=Narcine bancroftii TaxID=1343680 RepID=UPI0038320510